MRNGNPLVTAFILMLVAALQGCVSSSQCTSAECQADAKITAAVKEHLKAYRELAAPNRVDVETRGGVVYLTGQVISELQRDTAQRVAEQTPGVGQVVNSISLSYSGR
jgi:osmotically-inducible protein OsmY